MRYGMCMGLDSPENIKVAKNAGYDYIECNFGALSRRDDEVFNKFKLTLLENDIKCEAANCFMPGDLPIIGNDYTSEAYVNHVENGMRRGSEIGLKTVVFGSGGARRVPDGVSFAEGFRQLGDFLNRVVSPIAEKYGITVVIEPLRTNETNIIHSVTEGVMLAAMSGKDNIAGLADLYHVVGAGDTNDDIRLLKGSIKHAHLANPTGRRFPKSAEEFDYQSFIDALTYAGCERCSVEAGYDDYTTEAVETANFLKSIK